MNKSLYITAVVGNFLLLVYAAVLIVGICGGWLDRELWLHSYVAKVAQLLLMASAMGLLFANIRISHVRYGGRYLSLILCGNFFVNPLPRSIFSERQGRQQTGIGDISKRKVYLFLRNVQLFWLLYTLAAVFYTPLIDSKIGGIFYIALIIAVSVFIQRNIAIAIKTRHARIYIAKRVVLFFYAPDLFTTRP